MTGDLGEGSDYYWAEESVLPIRSRVTFQRILAAEQTK